jgi:aryl-alcohol dehydrogenase-like predicted oxidoreductase
MEQDHCSLDDYRLLGDSGLRVSPLCLGTMTFGTRWGWGADHEESQNQFLLYVERGGNFIDTANLYTNGQSEEYLGSFLKQGRDRLVVATKYSFGTEPELKDPNRGGNHRKNMFRALEDSLRRLKTDYIDLLWLHVWEHRTPVYEVMRAVDDLVRQGKVLYFGFSDTPAWKVAQAHTLATQHGWTPPIAIQHEYSLIERTVEHELMPMARELDLGSTPWGVLAGGVLTGKYNKNLEGESKRAETNKARLNARNLAIAEEVVKIASESGHTPAQVALNWLANRPGVTSPIIGARTMEQLDDLLQACWFTLDEEHLTRLDKATKPAPMFPASFIGNERVSGMITGGLAIEERLP